MQTFHSVVTRLLRYAALAAALAAASPVGAEEAYDPSKPAAPVAEPGDYRMEEFRKPVPATLEGARVVSSEEASALWTAKSAIFIDVYPHAPKPDNLPAGTLWREPTHYSIENAVWLANIGYGVLSAANEEYFKRNLEQLSGGDKGKALLFFCVRNCWMSWNAAKRALSYGYTNVIWYPDGSDGWQEIGQLVVDTKPAP